MVKMKKTNKCNTLEYKYYRHFRTTHVKITPVRGQKEKHYRTTRLDKIKVAINANYIFMLKLFTTNVLLFTDTWLIVFE